MSKKVNFSKLLGSISAHVHSSVSLVLFFFSSKLLHAVFQFEDSHSLTWTAASVLVQLGVTLLLCWKLLVVVLDPCGTSCWCFCSSAVLVGDFANLGIVIQLALFVSIAWAPVNLCLADHPANTKRGWKRRFDYGCYKNMYS